MAKKTCIHGTKLDMGVPGCNICRREALRDLPRQVKEDHPWIADIVSGNYTGTVYEITAKLTKPEIEAASAAIRALRGNA